MPVVDLDMSGARLVPEWSVHLSLFKASPSLQDLEKAQLELENQLGSERRESIRPKSANVQNASHTIPTQIEPKKPERNNALRRVKSTNDTGTQDLMQICRYYADLYRFEGKYTVWTYTVLKGLRVAGKGRWKDRYVEKF